MDAIIKGCDIKTERERTNEETKPKPKIARRIFIAVYVYVIVLFHIRTHKYNTLKRVCQVLFLLFFAFQTIVI